MRRKRQEEHVNHERWAIPYGDLITLLLAFFVVMYAMSAVNEGKYRVLSQSMMEAFHGTSRVIAPAPLAPDAPPSAAPAIDPQTNGHGSALTPIALPGSAAASAPTREQKNLNSIQQRVEQALQPLIDKKLVVIRRTPSWLEIEIRTDILFSSGVARIATPAQDVLNNLGEILAPFPNPLRVEGYTDNKPINTAVYPSNWELSAARAASVARLFSTHGVSPERLGIMGWGEVRPIADNTTEEGRNRNRRVLVVVLSDRDAPSRFTRDPGQLDPAAQAQVPAAAAPLSSGLPAGQEPPAVAPALADKLMAAASPTEPARAARGLAGVPHVSAQEPVP
ncbi:flagellar motor protein MotD [Dyella sp.]|jgi:chemotaxis protein MotB|uniref:flagellar motor protein MotD n=1 Tax=Dyella sp. TaxID=1869338 RepID=UPI002D7A159F|nr:flagellar motor protein MotD [Dyella sp.]HET6431116.1 flagellar motor protein MotD [Dyella sp.]